MYVSFRFYNAKSFHDEFVLTYNQTRKIMYLPMYRSLNDVWQMNTILSFVSFVSFFKVVFDCGETAGSNRQSSEELLEHTFEQNARRQNAACSV